MPPRERRDPPISGGGFIAAQTLGLLLVMLKLMEIIDWSWWWVLAPLIIPWLLTFLLAAVVIARDLATTARL